MLWPAKFNSSQNELGTEPREAYPQSDKLLQYISAFSICFIAVYVSPQSTGSL